MKHYLITIFLFFSVTLIQANTNNFNGTWQGTLTFGSQKLRQILHMEKNKNGTFNARCQSIDQGGFDSYINIDSVFIDGSDIKLKINSIHGTYEGKISSDGSSIRGTWAQEQTAPLDFWRQTKKNRWVDTSPHSVSFVRVEKDVSLEVLDWGGSGKPLVLLSGLGNTAHVFDTFAPKLISKYHVYGITRRGFGTSSAPTDPKAYTADQLGDDVVAVISHLKLNRPILIGHSIGGEELSSIGSRYPDRVAGLIYLDAGYGYAYYDTTHGDFNIDLIYLKKMLEELQRNFSVPAQKKLAEELLSTTLPRFEKNIKIHLKVLADIPENMPPPSLTLPILAVNEGAQKYTEIRTPVLGIFALPHDDAARSKTTDSLADIQAKAFETGIPSARVVRIPHANHFIFKSHESDVLREINEFIDKLPSK